jgi:hypothetical protein
MLGTLLCLSAAVYCTSTMLRFLETARSVRGELVGYASFRDDENTLLHQPIFRFADAGGQLVTTHNPRSVSVVRRLAIGEQYDLLYNPTNPAQVWRDTWVELWLVPAVLWAVSVLGIVQAMM